MARGAKGGDVDKPKGRMSAYAYFLQDCREQQKKKNPGQSVAFGDFTKQAAEQWKKMTDKDKAKFNKLAEKDKARYDGEMKGFVAAGGKKGGKGKKKKDPNAPKRSMSAFFWFCDEERPKVRKAHSDWTVGEVAKELGRRWSAVSEADKAKYQKQADKDKIRYTKEMAQYKNGKASKADPEDDDDDEEEDEDDDE